MKTRKRELAVIADEIRDTLKRETGSIIKIGELLVEAKKQVGHGEWLPWLKREFSLSERSAQNYMAAERFARKSAMNTDLLSNLSPSLLYVLSGSGRGALKHIYTSEAIAAILQEAKCKRVGGERAWEIAVEVQRALTTKAARPAETAKEEAAEADALLDATPELLPPSPAQPASARLNAQLQTFQQAVAALKKLSTSPAALFTGAAAPFDLETVADFLKEVAATSKRRAAA
jgi:hypothetical protein